MHSLIQYLTALRYFTSEYLEVKMRMNANAIVLVQYDHLYMFSILLGNGISQCIEVSCTQYLLLSNCYWTITKGSNYIKVLNYFR